MTSLAPVAGVYKTVDELLRAMELRAASLQEKGYDGTAEMLREAVRAISDTSTENERLREMATHAEGAVAQLMAEAHSEAREALEAAAKLCDAGPSDIKLLAGEMTASEMRAVRAVLKNRAMCIRALKEISK